MSVIFWNCSHGVTAKIDILKHYVSIYQPLALFVSEAEIKIDKSYDCIFIPGYKLEISKTVQFGKARTVAYVNENSKFKRQSELENGESEMIVLSDGRVRLCGVYRPFKIPNARSKDAAFKVLLESLERVVSGDADVVVGGDWNVNWLQRSSPMKRQLETWCEDNGLVQVVTENTRFQTVTRSVGVEVQSSCIDLVFQKTPKKVEVIPAIGSDHSLLLMNLSAPPISKKTTKKLVTVDWRNYSQQRAIEKFKIQLKNVRDEINASNSAGGLLEILTDCLVGTCNDVIPKRVVRLRDEKEFENSRIEALKKKRDRVWKKYKKTGNEKYYFQSKALTKSLLNTIRHEKRRVFRAKMQAHGAKSFWRMVGTIFNSEATKREEIILKNTDGRLISNPEDVSGMFAEYFDTKIQDLVSRGSPVISTNEEKCSHLSGWREFTLEEVMEALSKSKRKKSAGHDEIPLMIVKDVAEVIGPYLCVLFNRFMSEEIFPDDWRIAKVVPIHKKGERNLVTNYRPVSNLCSLSKIFERCLLGRINEFDLDDNTQHGFRPGHGTVTAALEIQHHVATLLDQRRAVAMYTVDMSAAFDLLRPRILDAKLLMLPMKLRRMVCKFLSERRAFVSVNGSTSHVFKIPTGVPQGSVLGPKLFSLYTNGLQDMMDGIDAKIVVYADDSYVICDGCNAEEVSRKMSHALTSM
jgi:hypothetical protein